MKQNLLTLRLLWEQGRAAEVKGRGEAAHVNEAREEAEQGEGGTTNIIPKVGLNRCAQVGLGTVREFLRFSTSAARACDKEQQI